MSGRHLLHGGRATLVTALILSAGALSGCAAVPRVAYQAERYRLDLRLDPARHELMGRATIDLARFDRSKPAGDGRIEIEFHLHSGLSLTHAEASGATVIGMHTAPLPKFPRPDEDGGGVRTHVVELRGARDSFTLVLQFGGTIFQDASAGEEPGQIHNLAMKAHIGEDGIFLNDGYWYPSPVLPADSLTPLCDFTVVAQPVEGFVLRATGQYNQRLAEQTGYLAWRSPFSIPSVALVGGPHEVHRTKHGDVSIEIQLKPSQADHAEGLAKAVARVFDQYEPLIGPYPGTEYAVVDNFFSSGFAFPTFTLLSSAVVDMGRRSQETHGYLDHEILHSWWGNGVLVDTRDGNWCEALTTYAANYYGHVLDENEPEARRRRRNYSHFLSRLAAKDDLPLGTYGLDGGCGRNIAYHKGAMVFHMLARRMGQEAFWAAMRRFTSEYVGRYAGWRDIRDVCEKQHGESLAQFFRQWVRSGGAPTIRIEAARYDSSQQVLTLDIHQGEPAFEIDLPVRVAYGDTSVDYRVSLRAAEETVSIPMDVVPITVEADPDYHIFRKIPVGEILPTTALTRREVPFVSVVAGDDPPQAYLDIRASFEDAVGKENCTASHAGHMDGAVFEDRNVLILGNAVRDPSVRRFLDEIQFPVTWTDYGFLYDGLDYVEAGDAILCTVRHPSVPGGGVTIVFANDVSAVPKAAYIPMYEHSTVVFKNGRPTVRADHERRVVVEVERS